MNISEPFIRRPVGTWLLSAALLLVGIVAYFRLPVSSLPTVDFPTLQVGASLPGASPETMASNVATPLERQLSLIPGITEMSSSSTVGRTSITVQFELSRDIDGAFQDTLAALNAAAGQLPANLPSPPTVRKVNPASDPIMILALQSDTLPVTEIDDYVDTVLAQVLSRIDGVGLVNIVGATKPAVRIRIDPRRAAQLGLQLDAVRAQIAAYTVNAPKGTLHGPSQSATIYANDQVFDAAVWNRMIVGYHHGAPVRLQDIGSAVQSVEDDQAGAWTFPGRASQDPGLHAGRIVELSIQKLPGSNVLQTVQRVKAALSTLQAGMPPAISLHIVADRTQTIRASVRDVELTLILTVLLVICVIFLFLRNGQATLIPSAALPLSLFGAAAVVFPLGYSLDNLSLMALAIAAGFVVDDAIVMLDVIWRRIEGGQAPLQAAVDGARDITFTILSIGISLITVFTPVMLMGGVVGRFVREFAITLSAAVVMSLIISLTLTPMLCGHFLKPPRHATHGFIFALERGFNAIENGYAIALAWVMRHKPIAVCVFMATTVLAVVLYVLMPTGFFPQQDTANFNGQLQTAQDSSFEYTASKIEEVGRIISQDPDVMEIHFNLNSSNINLATFQCQLRVKGTQRKATVEQVIARLRPKVAQVVGALTVMRASQDINIGARTSKAQYQYTLSDANLSELNEWAPKMLAALEQMPKLRDVSSDQQSNAAAVDLTIDRDMAGRFGIRPADIDAAIYNQIGQHQVAQYYTQLNAYRVIVEAPPKMQVSSDLFNDIYLLSSVTGKMVPLSLFVKVDPEARGSLSIAHQGQMPAVTLSFNLPAGVALGDVTKVIEQTRLNLGAPASLTGSFQGTAAAFQESLSSEPILILTALLSVYVILGVLYESFIHPLTIISTLPSAGVGALLALMVAGQELNIIGIIALILLIGIVMKNGIMIVDVALSLQREQGIDPERAVVQASHRRLRPILMTTSCAFFGSMPLIFTMGAGSEFRQPLGIAIVGGLLVSQALTLFTTPVIYVYLDRLRRRRSTQAAGLPSAAAAAT